VLYGPSPDFSPVFGGSGADKPNRLRWFIGTTSLFLSPEKEPDVEQAEPPVNLAAHLQFP
jgi:hypothetical protein